MNGDDEMMTVDELAKWAGVSDYTVRRWGREGRFGARKIVGGRWVFRRQTVLEEVRRSAPRDMVSAAAKASAWLALIERRVEFIRPLSDLLPETFEVDRDGADEILRLWRESWAKNSDPETRARVALNCLEKASKKGGR